ncbi:MAG: RNA polymerase sigma factor [Chloroflexota bacterium]
MEKRTNEEWHNQLTPPPNEQALEDLRALLVRGLRYALSSRVDSNLDALVEDFVQEALIKILDKLDTFRGESQFTTWAQKIAVRVALTELRRKRWRDSSLDEMTTSRDGESFFEPKILSDPTPSPENRTSQGGMISMVQNLIVNELTDRQRRAMTMVMLEGVPMDEAAKKLDTNRNALYKLIHDARVRLKKRLEDEGLTPQDVLSAFEI